MDRERGKREKSPVRELLGKKGGLARWGEDTTEVDRELDKYRNEEGKLTELQEQAKERWEKGGKEAWGKE